MPNKILKKKPKNKKPKKKPIKKSVKYILRNPKVNMTPQVIYKQGLTQTLQPESTKTHNELINLKNDYDNNNQLLNRKFDNETITLNNRLEDQNKNLLNRLDNQTSYFNNMGEMLAHRIMDKPIKVIEDKKQIKTLQKPKKHATKEKVEPTKEIKEDILPRVEADYNPYYSDIATKYPSSFHDYYNDIEKDPDEYLQFDIGEPDENKNQKVTLTPIQTRSQTLKNNQQVVELQPVPKNDKPKRKYVYSGLFKKK